MIDESTRLGIKRLNTNSKRAKDSIISLDVGYERKEKIYLLFIFFG
jgi:hypothetical protein